MVISVHFKPFLWILLRVWTESLTYSCFCELMKRMSANFPHGGAMDTHFANMRSLIQVSCNICYHLLPVIWDITMRLYCQLWKYFCKIYYICVAHCGTEMLRGFITLIWFTIDLLWPSGKINYALICLQYDDIWFQILDAELFEHMHHHGDYTHFYFCYRWFLLDFKRGRNKHLPF